MNRKRRKSDQKTRKKKKGRKRKGKRRKVKNFEIKRIHEEKRLKTDEKCEVKENKNEKNIERQLEK